MDVYGKVRYAGCTQCGKSHWVCDTCATAVFEMKIPHGGNLYDMAWRIDMCPRSLRTAKALEDPPKSFYKKEFEEEKENLKKAFNAIGKQLEDFD